jgi:hypothetical protein
LRQQWITDARAANNEHELGVQLLLFESYVLWDVVSPNWHDRRAAWIEDCKAL